MCGYPGDFPWFVHSRVDVSVVCRILDTVADYVFYPRARTRYTRACLIPAVFQDNGNLMADSLRDQLIAAGFEAPKKPPAKKKGKPRKKTSKSPHKGAHAKANHGKSGKTSKKSAQAEDPQAVLERKKLKAQIQVLIDENKVEDFKGEITYRYLVDKRIREMYVNEAIHKKLTTREISITRLNGTTFLVPRDIALDIKKINPQWSVFNTEEDATPSTKDDEYSEFQVPDDLKW